MLFNFHLYGLIVGLALVVGLFLVEKKMDQLKLTFRNYYIDLLIVFFFGVIGARLWHVATDFYLYAGEIMDIFLIWQGGLSILGAVVGGVIGVLVVSKLEKIPVYILLDLIVFGLPMAQSVGRWANYFNQELYGLATDLPWAIMINENKYHPLFLYESLAMLIFGLAVWLKVDNKKIGTGQLIWFYLLYYSFLRFLLDFIRLEKPVVLLGLGINQIILIAVFLLSSYILSVRYSKTNEF